MALTTHPSATANRPAETTGTYTGALAMVTTLFFMWGFITSLNDILIPHLKSIFDLNYFEVMLVQFFFFLAYAVFSIPAGIIIERVGYKKSMVAGLLIMGFGSLLFVPAAMVPSFPLFLVALAILATGITDLQVSANPYVAVLGSAQTASSRLTLTQAFNSLGTVVGPRLGAALILGGAVTYTADQLSKMSAPALHAYRVQAASTVKLPYVFIAIALVVLGIVISVFKLPQIPEAEGGHATETGANDSIWRHRNLVMGAVGIFTYVGAEVAIGSFLVNYLHEPYIGNLTLEQAAAYLAFGYWFGAMVGRFAGSWVLRQISPRAVLAFNALVAASLVCLSMATTGHFAMWSIILVGLFNSIMFPTIFTLGIEGLGPLTGEGSGLLNTAIVGGAVIPLLQGLIADRIGIHHAFILPVLCYLYIALFAVKGTRRRPLA
ncbi:MAG: sugar MFS transporter [Candidatus Korobacteraceae bacterium]